MNILTKELNDVVKAPTGGGGPRDRTMPEPQVNRPTIPPI